MYKQKGSGALEITKGQLQYALINWVTGKTPILDEHAFSKEFKAYYADTEKGIVNLIKVNQGLATITNESELFAAIWEKLWSLPDKFSDYKTDEANVSSVVKLFKKTRHPLFIQETPKIFCWESEKEVLAFNRLLDPPELSHCWPHPEFFKLAPLYSDFIERCQYPIEVRQFLGSLLDPLSDRKLVLWFWGDSNGGKSSFLTALLNAIFGFRGFAMMSVDPGDNRFMKEGLINKLCAMGDECDPKFLKSSLFKQLTGSTRHHINPKGKTAFLGDIRCKFIFTSNPLPEIPRDNSYLTRVLLNQVASIPAKRRMKEHDVEQGLKQEFPYILADIRHAYEHMSQRKIMIPKKNHEKSTQAHEEPLQLVFDSLFEYCEKDEVTGKPYCHMTSGEFGDLISPKINNRDVTLRKFYKFLLDKYKIEAGKMVKYGGKSQRMVPHLKARRHFY